MPDRHILKITEKEWRKKMNSYDYKRYSIRVICLNGKNMNIEERLLINKSHNKDVWILFLIQRNIFCNF
ncbi:MAG: hypothetical protein ACD_3C00095G0002 [uncultured bacterium (gcode 4)]|uniref:Uncharacterized protein n=1 Tax=uncultured bacterium (gcode 4) TaxID=1234023 RepID=K2GD28_9BACT|nr:MAG: hypothetical protein ACD_3C00095G0002 [uncultured bacterium (gcode 4)]